MSSSSAQSLVTRKHKNKQKSQKQIHLNRNNRRKTFRRKEENNVNKIDSTNTKYNKERHQTMNSNDSEREYESETSDVSNQKKTTSKLNAQWEQLFQKMRNRTIPTNQIRHIDANKNKTHQSKILDLHGHYAKENVPFGDNIMADLDYECFLFHNINGIKDENNWFQIMSTMKELNITGFGFAETNMSMKGYLFQKWNDIIRKMFRVSRSVSSESDIDTGSEYKPGGTFTAVVDKWQSRTTETGTDDKGLGRWSYIKLSSNKKKLVIITAYKPCKTMGPTTTWTQHWLMLRETQKDPEPLKEFLTDFNEVLKKWTSQGHEIILMIDANEEIGCKPGGLGQVLATNGLHDIIANFHDTEEFPNTYLRGTKRIDYIFGTRGVLQNCKACGMLPFCYGYPSDHRAIFIKIDLQNVLSSKIHPTESIASRLIHSATPKEREKFLMELDAHYIAQNLYDRLNELWMKAESGEWSINDEEEYNKCDEQHILGMLAAEKKTCKVKLHPWSPKFSKAVETKNFWKIMLTMKRHHVRLDHKAIVWGESLGISNVNNLSIQFINSKLREAQKNLREIKKEAVKLREDHLRELLQLTQDAANDRNHEKRLRILIRAHEKKYYYRKIQHILKPQQRSGLSHVLVPEDMQPNQYPYDPDEVKTWKMVHEHNLLQEYLLERNKQHFGQAHGTPFTVQPLSRLDWGAGNHYAEKLLQGEIQEDISVDNQYAQDVLSFIAKQKQLPEIDIFIPPDEIAKGFRKWKETTATSPSGCHLGLRRIPAIPTNDEELEKTRQQILYVQTHIINIPLQSGFSPRRWQTVVNAMLEKISGRPLLHKLRVIHILEADYNLVLKTIFGRRLMKNCEVHGSLGDIQDGFRKGRSTTRTLLHNEIVNDYNKRLRIDNYVGMTDISGCFDRILPSIISLLNRRNGCPSTATEMHARTLKHAKYYLKTQNGVSEMFYSNDTTPVYGNGQGAGDSPSQWSQESAMLLKLYEERVQGTSMSLRTGETIARLPMAAFADDINLLGNNDKNNKSRVELVQEVQMAFSTWDKLLHATGHFMELGKCASYLSLWEFEEDGFAYTMPPEEHQQEISVTDIEGNVQKIQQLPTNKSQKLLGVMKCPIGDQQDEIKRLQSKSDNFARRLNSNYLTRTEARLAYETFYIPAMRYSLNITAINQTDMETIQAKATMAFLSAQGYNRNMPRAVVFAPKIYQGIGMRHLYDLQGADSTRLLLQELNQENSPTQHMLIALIDAIQLEAGIGKSILEDCRPLDYLEWGWIPQIRDFLHHINGQIILGRRQQKTYRVNDTYLMDSPYLSTISRKERIYIHRCRLFQQVTLMSDIATAAGSQIHNAWFHPESAKPSKSTLTWPRQNSPCKEAWNSWKKFLRSFERANGKLRKPLGPWIDNNKERIHQAYGSLQGDILWITQRTGKFQGHPLLQKHRRNMDFLGSATTSADSPSPDTVPVDIVGRHNGCIRSSNAALRTSQQTEKRGNKVWYERAPEHLKHLVGKIRLIASIEEIQSVITERSDFIIASDGGHDPDSGISSFGWALAVNATVVAKGRGPVQAAPMLAESFRAEGYGLASACLFARNLSKALGINPKDHRWRILIDSKSLIQRISKYRTHINTPRWNLRPDEDICKVAFKLLQSLPATLVHIKSHQEKTAQSSDSHLDITLNDIADNEATCQRNSMTKPAHQVDNIGVAQLRLHNMAITRESQRWLLQVAGRIPIQQYYRDRYGWSANTFNSISWETQWAVLRQYNQDDQTRIIKFVHGWLPTQSRKFKEGDSASPRCRLCSAMVEDNIHLWSCSHDAMVQLQQKFLAYTAKSIQEQADSELANLLELAVTESAANSSWTPRYEYTSKEWQPGVQSQNKIGWQQLLSGRISRGLIAAVDDHYKNLGMNSMQFNGERWARNLIKTLWDITLELWKTRNDQLNKHDVNSKIAMHRERLEQKVHRYYEYKDKLRHHERVQWFSDPSEVLLQKDVRQIEAWVRAVARIISITKREAKKRPRESVIMERFVSAAHYPTHDQHQLGQIQHPSHYPQELKPD